MYTMCPNKNPQGRAAVASHPGSAPFVSNKVSLWTIRSMPTAGPAMIDATKRDFTMQRGLPADELLADSSAYAAQPDLPA